MKNRKQAADEAVLTQKARVTENINNPTTKEKELLALKVKVRSASSVARQMDAGKNKLGLLAEKELNIKNQVSTLHAFNARLTSCLLIRWKRSPTN